MRLCSCASGIVIDAWVHLVKAATQLTVVTIISSNNHCCWLVYVFGNVPETGAHLRLEKEFMFSS